MKTLFRIFLICLALVTAVIILSTAYLFTLDPNDYKERVANEFSQATGRQWTLGGDIDFSVYPWFGFTVNNVAVGNPPGFGDQPMFSADYAALRIKLLPMLNNSFEIDTVHIQGVSLNLIVAEDGSNNWADLTSAEVTDTPSAGPGNDAPLGNILLGGVDIRNVNLTVDDRANDVRYAVEDFTFTTGALTYGDPIDMNLTFTASASRPRLTAEVNFTATANYDLDNGRYDLDPIRLRTVLSGANVPDGSANLDVNTAVNMDLDAGTLSVPSLNLTALNTRLQARIDGRGLNGNSPVYEADVNLSGSDMALLLRIAGVEPLAGQIAALPNRAFNLQTTVTATTDTVSVADLQAGLLGSTLSGTINAASLQSGQPVISGQLNAAGPDLPAVVEVIGQLSGGRDSTLAQAGRELRVVNDKAFSVDSRFDANLQQGRVDVPTLDVRLLGATLNGSLNASEINSDSPVLRGNLTAAGPDLPLMLQIGGWFHDGVESPIYQYGERLNSVGNKSFTVNAQFDADIGAGNIQVPVLSAQGLGLALDGTVSTRDMSNSRGTVTGNLNLSGSNLREVLTAIDQGDLGEVLQSLSMQVGVSGGRSDLTVSPARFDVTLAGGPIGNTPVTVALNAPSRINLDRETVTLEALTLTGLGLDVNANINAANILSAPNFDGRVAVENFNPRRLLQQLNQPAPDTSDATVLQDLAFNAQFSGSADHLSLEELDLQLDDTSVRGRLALPDLDGPSVEFDLSVSDLDVDRYLPATEAPAAGSSNAGTTELPVELLRSLSVNGELSVARLGIAGLTLSEITLGLNAREGQLQLSPLRTSLYEGSFDGNASLNVNPAIPQASLTAELRQVAMGALLQDLMNATYVTGQGNVQLTLEASGADTNALKAGLNGSGRIALEDGVLRGVDVASVLNQLETMIRSRRPADVQRGEQTAFDSFAATLAINDGVVSSNDMLIRSPGFQVSGRGTVMNLNDNSIAFDLLTSVDAATATRDSQQYDIGGYSLPIACSGTLSAPRCLPDVGEIIRGAVETEVRERVGDLIQRAIGVDTPQAAPDATTGPSPAPAEQLINRALDRLLPR
ncbi:MAG: hypothetical protein RLZZ385_1227 [Pseudomonadota bacterium]|jgi:AsmA protein